MAGIQRDYQRLGSIQCWSGQEPIEKSDMGADFHPGIGVHRSRSLFRHFGVPGISRGYNYKAGTYEQGKGMVKKLDYLLFYIRAVFRYSRVCPFWEQMQPFSKCKQIH